MALYELRHSDEYEVVALLTSVSEEFQRISHHGVREVLLEMQAEAVGVPLEKVYLPSNNGQPCTNDVYEKIMADKMDVFIARGIKTVAFGDLFLEDLRAWRRTISPNLECGGIFPVWKRDTTQACA